MSTEHTSPEKNNKPYDIPKEASALITRPETLGDDLREATLTELERIASAHTVPNRKFVERDGEKYWAYEYPQVFTFNGQLRGKFEKVHRDHTKRPPEQFIASMGGERGLGGGLTHVVIEMEDGEKVMIEKTTPDTLSASKQKFEMLSTAMVRGAKPGSDPTARREVSTDMLKDVVVMPGHPLVLNPAQEGGDRLQVASGNVKSVTGVRLEQGEEVAPNNPLLKRFGDTLVMAEFEHAVEVSKVLRKYMGKSAVEDSGLVTR